MKTTVRTLTRQRVDREFRERCGVKPVAFMVNSFAYHFAISVSADLYTIMAPNERRQAIPGRIALPEKVQGSSRQMGHRVERIAASGIDRQ